MDHIRRGVHQPQHQRRGPDPHSGEHQAGGQSQHDGGMDSLAQLFPVFRPVILGDDHRSPGGQTAEKADQGVDDGAGAAHGGQGLLAHKVSHDERIHGVIQLLKQIAQHQRNGKGQQQPGNAAPGHVRIVFFFMSKSQLFAPPQQLIKSSIALFPTECQGLAHKENPAWISTPGSGYWSDAYCWQLITILQMFSPLSIMCRAFSMSLRGSRSVTIRSRPSSRQLSATNLVPSSNSSWV